MIASNNAFNENDANNKKRSPELNAFEANRDIIQDRTIDAGTVKPGSPEERDSLYKK